MNTSSPYGWLMLAGIFVSLALWSRVAKRDSRLVLIYIAALAGAFLGAKLVYLAAEGWLHWHDENRWLILATGKSITGALLGGYAGVEIAKRLLGYRGVTGDWFALIAPLSIMLGRAGCVLHGCCLGVACQPAWFTVNDATGVARWPAAQVELLFNVVMLLMFLWLRGRARHSVRAVVDKPSLGAHGVTRPTIEARLSGQHFHLYLIAYGAFRFIHEFWRETPQILGPISGYQIAALALVVLGCVRFRQRRSVTPEFLQSPATDGHP